MLDHLIVQNYRLFKDLNIPKLGQVNLVTGKNNAGKSTLLEVIRIWASHGSVINHILLKRGDWELGKPERTYASLFPNRSFDHDHTIIKLNEVSINFKRSSGGIDISKLAVKDDQGDTNTISFSDSYKDYIPDAVVFIPASVDFDNTTLWNEIELTPREDDVKRILSIIVPDLIELRISTKGAKVRLKNSEIPAPLKNFGEGTNRLLMIALALVSAKGNILLIDEIDLGLHYTVQEKLWEIIFQFAKEWNIQVFATTHSYDCLSAFSYVANREIYKDMGISLRLQKQKDNVIAVDYSPEELEDAIAGNIETR